MGAKLRVYKDLHCITFMPFILGCLFVCFSKKKKIIIIIKKMERGMWKDVFCITYHGCVVKVGHIIFA